MTSLNKPVKYLFLLMLILPAFIVTAQRRKKEAEKLPPEMQQLLNRKNYISKEIYWMLVQNSDSTCKIRWHTASFTRETKSDFNFYWARHFHLEWKNNDYLALHTHTGSEAWFDVFLPLKKHTKEIFIDSPIAFDKYNSLVAQICYNDTILKVTNLRSGKEQFIIEKKRKCYSLFTGSCIDKIYFNKNTLIFNWTVPSKFAAKTHEEMRKIKLHI